MVKVDDEDAAGPLERDHLVLLVLPAHVARVGRQPAMPLLGLVHGRVKFVEMFVPVKEYIRERFRRKTKAINYLSIFHYVPEVLIVNEVELAARIMVRRVVASSGKVQPLWMAWKFSFVLENCSKKKTIFCSFSLAELVPNEV